MGRKVKVSPKQKFEVANDYLSGREIQVLFVVNKQ